MTAKFKRDPAFITQTFLVPVMTVTGLTILTFLLPPDSESKLDIQITVMLANAVYMTIVSDNLPPSKSTPLIRKLSPYGGNEFSTVICFNLTVLVDSTIAGTTYTAKRRCIRHHDYCHPYNKDTSGLC